MLLSIQQCPHSRVGVQLQCAHLQVRGLAEFSAAWPLKRHIAICKAANAVFPGGQDSDAHVQLLPPVQQQHPARIPQRPSIPTWSQAHAQVLHDIRHRGLVPQGAHVLLAVSGGQDSMCMARLMLDLQGILGLQLSVAHGDHRMRPDSAGNAAFVRQWAQGQGLPYYERKATKAILTSEAQARAWRYQQLADMAQQAGCTIVAIGHTATDRAETLLFNLCRGTGTDGMTAMRWQRYVDTATPGILLIRPMLNLMREDTIAVCQATGTQVWEDSTNADTRYSRNSMRLQVLPLLQGLNRNAVQHLAEAAELLTADVECLKAQASELLRASRAAAVDGVVPSEQRQGTFTVQVDTTAEAPSPSRQSSHVGQDGVALLHKQPTSSSPHTQRGASISTQPHKHHAAQYTSNAQCQDGIQQQQQQQQRAHGRAARTRVPLAPATSDIVPALDRFVLAAAPLALQRRALHQHLQEALGGKAPTNLHVEAVRDLLTAGHGSRSNTMPGGVTACVDGLCIRILHSTVVHSQQTKDSL